MRESDTKGGGFVLGVDGCRAGWVSVRRCDAGASFAVAVSPNFATLLAGPAAGARCVMVDMPIGLAETGRRACEAMARSLLKPRRHASVFPTPARAMLNFDRYEDANAWGKARGPGGGLPKQTWMIVPKIRELDAVLTPKDQSRIAEAHPEVAFWRLNGEVPCHYPKRKADGRAERVALLKAHGVPAPEDLSRNARAIAGAGVADDDVYDACALALTAEARSCGLARQLTDGARDARGFRMEIWG